MTDPNDNPIDDGGPVPPMPSDTEMLDWLQSQNDMKQYTGRCIFRQSSTGRGWRLHETSGEGSFETVRAAIAAAMIAEGRRRKGEKP